jgi:hypothetical protein
MQLHIQLILFISGLVLINFVAINMPYSHSLPPPDDVSVVLESKFVKESMHQKEPNIYDLIIQTEYFTTDVIFFPETISDSLKTTIQRVLEKNELSGLFHTNDGKFMLLVHVNGLETHDTDLMTLYKTDGKLSVINSRRNQSSTTTESNQSIR